ncbi:hypothetical protein BVX99_01585 [bacterium F16]|nr:hypothetical protein BVX99_01585 [bacterium F16]
MSYRVAQYHLDDFILDYDSVAESLNSACHRDHRHYRISGICQSLNDHVVFIFEEDYNGHKWTYVIKPFSGETATEIAGDVHSRWQGKFATKGLIQLNGQALGVFEHAESPRKHVG